MKRWKIKKRLEAKAEEEARQRALRARGNFSTWKMLVLAVQVRVNLSLIAMQYQHRVIQLFTVYDKGLSRLTRCLLIFATMFLNMAITGFFCQTDSNAVSSAIKAVLIQKVVLALLYQLMVKKPKKKMIKFDPDLKVKPPKEKERPKPTLTMSYKLSP